MVVQHKTVQDYTISRMGYLSGGADYQVASEVGGGVLEEFKRQG